MNKYLIHKEFYEPNIKIYILFPRGRCCTSLNRIWLYSCVTQAS
jgi:hypothetical protein